jgi:hypothetical protein
MPTGRGTDGEQPNAAAESHTVHPSSFLADNDRKLKRDPGHVGMRRGARPLRVLVREAMEERPHVRRASAAGFPS